MKYYHELVTTDREVRYIAPQYVHIIQQVIDRGNGDEHIGSENLRVKDIKYFRASRKPYVDETNLLEGGVPVEQHVFPTESEAGIKSIAVKKQVPRRMLDYYSKSPGYTVLAEEDNWADVGFWIPSHHITDKVEPCTADEVRRLR